MWLCFSIHFCEKQSVKRGIPSNRLPPEPYLPVSPFPGRLASSALYRWTVIRGFEGGQDDNVMKNKGNDEYRYRLQTDSVEVGPLQGDDEVSTRDIPIRIGPPPVTTKIVRFIHPLRKTQT
jgi:hypothetical protein